MVGMVVWGGEDELGLMGRREEGEARRGERKWRSEGGW